MKVGKPSSCMESEAHLDGAAVRRVVWRLGEALLLSGRGVGCIGGRVMGIEVIESTGAHIPSRRMHRDPHSQQVFGVSARSHTPQSFATASRADIGESAAYKQALLRG